MDGCFSVIVFNKYVICLYISLFFRQADALKASITGKKGFYYQ